MIQRGLFLSVLILFNMSQFTLGQMDNIIEKKDGAEKPKVSIVNLSPNVVAKLCFWVKNPKKTQFDILDKFLGNLENQSSTDYSFYDYFLYIAGSLSQVNRKNDIASCYYKLYLDRRSKDDAFNQFPSHITNPQSDSNSVCELKLVRMIKKLRKLTPYLQEKIWKEWGNDRWNVEICKADQKGFEYSNVLANHILLGTNATTVTTSIDVSDDSSKYSNVRVFQDYKLLWLVIKDKKEGKADDFPNKLKTLKESNSIFSVPDSLLARLEKPPKLVLGIIVYKAGYAALILLLLTILFIIIWYFIPKKSEIPSTSLQDSKYNFHQNDFIANFLLNQLNASKPAMLILSLLFFNVGLILFAWAEDSLRRETFIINRALLDYYSFPYAYLLMIPTFIFIVFFYKYGSKVAKKAIETVSNGSSEVHDEAITVWRKYRKFMTSKVAIIFLIVIVISAEIGLKNQWIKDPGTAFVDIWYPGHISLTGLYYTLISTVAIYITLTILFRFLCFLLFIASIFSKKNHVKWKAEPKYEINHPDRCNGLRSIGAFVGIFYIIMILLATLLVLTMVEKLRFYESIEVVLEYTYISVGLFGIMFFSFVPILVIYPMFSIHRALRRFRFSESMRLLKLIKLQEKQLYDKVKKNECDEYSRNALAYLLSLKDRYHKMSLWPIDFKSFFVFLFSNILPIIAFLPILLRL